jgi:nitrite reductase/ring-hydroxylating ferredoxin subunit
MSSVRIGRMDEIADGGHRVVAVGKFEVGVFRQGERLLAYENRCPHYDGPVCQGKIFNRVEEVVDAGQKHVGLRFATERHIVCPWHGWEFNIETGIHPGDQRMRLKKVAVEVRDGDIYVDVPTRR